jgi:pyrimidine-nucleoside phosphorylase
MDTPLGYYSGNRLEVQESIDILKGEGPEDSTQLTKEFAKKMLQFAGHTSTNAEALIEKTIESGRAYEKFNSVVRAQGGSLEKFQRAMKSSKIKTYSWISPRQGYLWFDVRKLGLALVELGAGRKRKDDKIDPDVGFYHPLETGLKIAEKQEIVRISYRDKSRLNACLRLLNEAIEIREESFSKSPLVRKILST